MKIEENLRSTAEKQRIAGASKKGGLRDAMETGQVSAYHTEGETVRSHYRLIFDALHAASAQSSPDRMKKLPDAVQEAIRELNPSIVETFKTYPNMLRAAVLFHDIAKTTKNRTINLTEMSVPEDASPEDAELLASLKTNGTSEKELKKTIEKNKKALEKKPDAELQKQLEAAQMGVIDAKKALHAAYDALREKYSSAGVYEKFKVGVGFQGPEKMSADILRTMDIDPEAKSILLTVVEDHIIPLQKFDGELAPKECAKRYRQAFGTYSTLEFKLSTALASLDILGSMPADKHTDLSPVKNIMTGKREAWIEDRILEEKKLLLAERLKGLESSAIDFKTATEEEKAAAIKIREARKEIEDQIEKELREKYEAAYMGQ